MRRCHAVIAALFAAATLLPEAGRAASPPAACYVGVVAARGAVELSAAAAGRLTVLPIAVGQRVAAGQLLARIDAPAGAFGLAEATARLAAARSGLAAAEVGVKKARRELARRQGTPEIFALEQIEAAEYELELSQLELEGRQAAVAQAEANRARGAREEEERSVRAPFAATVAALYAAPGAALESGRPLLQLLPEASPLVRFAAPPEDLPLLRPGAAVRLEPKAGGKAALARIETVSPALDPASGLVFLEATYGDTALPELPAGTLVRVSAGAAPCGGRPLALGLPETGAAASAGGE